VTASQCAKNGVVSLCCSKFGQRKGTPQSSHIVSILLYLLFNSHTDPYISTAAHKRNWKALNKQHITKNGNLTSPN